MLSNIRIRACINIKEYMSEELEKEKQNKKPKLKSRLKKILIGIVIVLLVLVGLVANEFREMGKMREAFQVQREAQINFWKEQGLSEEEIDEKLSELRGEQMGAGRMSGPGMAIMRTIGRVTGGRMNHP